MPAKKKPASHAPITEDVSPPPAPQGFAYHTICGDRGWPGSVELNIALPSDQYGKGEVTMRFFLGHVWGIGHGASGWAHVDLPVDHIERIALELLDTVKVAQHHGMLPKD